MNHYSKSFRSKVRSSKVCVPGDFTYFQDDKTVNFRDDLFSTKRPQRNATRTQNSTMLSPSSETLCVMCSKFSANYVRANLGAETENNIKKTESEATLPISFALDPILAWPEC